MTDQPRRYQVKEHFGPTLQGEGPHAGWPCVFLRLSGCNAWDGRAETRAASACPYCDTDFRGGESLATGEILDRLARLAPSTERLGCVLTGGEPLLQADLALIGALAERFAWLDIETNGTRPCPSPRPENCSLVCSPKAIPGAPLRCQPDAWKILIPDQLAFLDQALASAAPVWLQPTCPDDGPSGAVYQAHLAHCLELAFRHGCRLSLQLHKYLGLP